MSIVENNNDDEDATTIKQAEYIAQWDSDTEEDQVVTLKSKRQIEIPDKPTHVRL
jgi:hypothetical protein